MRENAIPLQIGRVIVCGCLLTMSVLSGRTALGGSDTTFYVVRHAERAETPTNDLPLTEQGMRRAEELREVLGDVPLSAVYATQTLRTFQTAMPTAAAARLEITTYDQTDLTPTWATLLKQKHAGKSVLIVSHSGMVEKIVQLLGGTTVPPIGDVYDRLFVVTVRDGVAQTEPRRYHVLEVGKEPLNLGLPHELKNISAIAPGPGNHVLVAGDDETNSLQILARQDNGQYQAQEPIALVSPESKEIDIEGITRHGADLVFYIVGSHDARRHSIFRREDQSKAVDENRERFERKPEREKDRERLIRLAIDPQTGQLQGSLIITSLRDNLESHPVLSGFIGAASKENGIDIEGIASDGQRLYVGFRGPVLRGGLAPVLVFEADHPEAARVRYVALQGHGIRDLARVDVGFLIIAGPVGDLPGNYRLCHWDGNDCLPGQRSAGDVPQGRVALLGTIPAPPGAAPEGLAVLGASTDSYDLLIVYDGPPGGQPTRVRAARP